MITPILATENPHEAAKRFEKLGWNIDFMTPLESDDPISQVSLFSNEILLGTMAEKYVPKEAIPFIGTGVEIHLSIPAKNIISVYENHKVLNPSDLSMQTWGEMAFHVIIEGYRFLVAAE
jgi:hypothetical protein